MGASALIITMILCGTMAVSIASPVNDSWRIDNGSKSVQKRSSDRHLGNTAMGSEIKKETVKGAQSKSEMRDAVKAQIAPVARAAMSGIIMCVCFGVFYFFCGDILGKYWHQCYCYIV